VYPQILNLKWAKVPENAPIGGRIRHCLHNWKLITSDISILNIVRGSVLELTKPRPRRLAAHTPSFSHDETMKIQQEINSMLDKEAIKPVSEDQVQYMSHLFLRPKKDGTFRPIFNLKSLNRFIQYRHFKVDGMKELKNIIMHDDWMITVDLKDAYLTVPMAPKHQPLLSFRWKTICYQFQVLPFGLSSAPRTFTKLLKPVMSLLRKLNIRTQIYLDDLIVLSQNLEQIQQDRDTVLFLLQQLGFMINWEKSQLNPTRKLEYLGFVIDSQNMELTLPQNKILKIIKQCTWLRAQETVSIRELAQTIGQLVASTEAILPAPLYYRHTQVLKIQALKSNAKNYAQEIRLSPEARDELDWWITNMENHNGKAIISPYPDMTLVTDASKKGWGATNGVIPTQGLWSSQEQLWHINVLELKAAEYAVRAYTKGMMNIHVHLKLDNSTAVAYIRKMGGTRSPMLLEHSLSLWNYCLDNKISLSAEHLPGILNQEADWQSREYQDTSNWMLNREVFLEINQLMGPLEIDLFADRLNAQLDQFVSWKPDPKSWTTDAFTVKWNGFLPYMFPPFNQINKCLRKIQRDMATAVIVTPIWSTQAWYSTLLEMSSQVPVLLPQDHFLLLDPLNKAHPLIMAGSLRLAAWKVTAEPALRQDFLRTLLSISTMPDGKVRKLLTKAPGRSGTAGVVSGKLIPFQRL